MNGWQRLAGLWGALFPVAALLVFAVVLSLGARGAGPDAAPGQTSGASQTTAQSGGTTSGGGSGGSMNSTTTDAMSGGSAAATTSPAATASTPAASASASSTGTAGSAQNAAAPSGNTQSGTQATAVAAQSSPEGAQIYTSNCASCHGPAGAGVAGAFPPLAGNKTILGSEKYVADVLLYGLQGQIAVNGQTYNGVMPAWAATLSDAQIAAVLDHVRSSWGNSASAVTAATVKAERATPLTAAQVLAERPQ